MLPLHATLHASRLQLPIQVRQQGTTAARTLEPGTRQPVQWQQADRPLRLCVRVLEPGWSWSGGIALDLVQPGDLFIKVRRHAVP